MTSEFDEVMTEFAAEMESFEERMTEVSNLLSTYESFGSDSAAGVVHRPLGTDRSGECLRR